MVTTLPECFTYYGEPVAPNGPCLGCAYANICISVIHVSELTPIISKIEQIEETLRRISA